MKAKFTNLTALVLFIVTIVSCRKDQFRSSSETNVQKALEKNAYQVQFTKTFAKAIKEEPGLRTFIKKEALKQFDRDYDILFQMVKDQKVDGKTTVYDMLAKYADEKEAFDKAIDNLPLLTIFVPTLPNLTPENWNPDSQIPVIAVEPDRRINAGKISLYNEKGKYTDLSPLLTPGFPVLVVKNNERVVLNTTNEETGHKVVKSESQPFFSNGKFSFRFWDNAFNGLAGNDPNARIGFINRPNNYYTIDKVNVDAYSSGSEWQRDFIYYGITPSVPNGEFTNRYSEFITNFQFLSGDHLGIVSDHANDPRALNEILGHAPAPGEVLWTDGNFEFRISIFINAKNGVGQELRKGFSAKGGDIFTLQYEERSVWFGTVWVLVGATPNYYDPNIEIVPWDLEQYGTGWKFAVSEFDPTEEITRTVTHTSTYASNFEVSLPTGTKIKVGAKFGLTATSQSTTQYQYKVVEGPNDFFEGVLDFRTPVITGLGPFLGTTEVYTTYEVSTGYVSMSVEPKRIY